MRPVYTRGKRVVQDVARVRTVRALLPFSPTLDEYADDGEKIAIALAVAVHARTRPDDRLETASAGWRAAGRRYTKTGMGRAIRLSGLTVDQAIEQMRAEMFDPFAAGQ
jgi:hypothetical protein